MKVYILSSFCNFPFFVLPATLGGACSGASGTDGHLLSDTCPWRDLSWEPGKVCELLLRSWAAIGP